MDYLSQVYDKLATLSPTAIAVPMAVVASIPLLKWLFKGEPCHDRYPRNKVILHAFGNDRDSPHASGYCQKVETYLRITGTPYEVHVTTPNKAPKGKLPVIIYNGQVVPDSTFIIEFLIANSIAPDLDAGLSALQVADSHSWQAYLEEMLYTCTIYERWMVDTHWPAFRDATFATVPWLPRMMVTWNLRRYIKKLLRTQGIGKHSVQEVYRIQQKAVEDIAARLGDNEYFHGKVGPTTIDVVLYSFVVNQLDSLGNPHLNSLYSQHPNIIAYAKRMTNKHFPSYKQMLAKLDRIAAN